MADKNIPGTKPTGVNNIKNQDLSKYNVENLSYPENLGQAPDLQHYVVFFINVRGKSELDKNNVFSASEVPVSSIHKSLTTNEKVEALGSSLQPAILTRAAGVAAAAAAGKFADGFLKGQPRGSASSSGAQSAKSAISNIAKRGTSAAAQAGYEAARVTTLTLAAGGVAALAFEGAQALTGALLEPDKALRLKDIITLHVEEKPSVKYGINYQETDLGSLLGILSNIGTASGAEEVKQTLQAGAAVGAYNLARVPSLLPGGGPKLQDVVGAFAKAKTNPFREVLFESIDYRRFNFRYRFFPKSKKETDSVYSIIKKFKEHMHPQLAARDLFYIYPSEFEIKYYYRDKENTWLNRISRCALEDMAVDYGGEQFSTFDNGAPTEIGLTLSFKELDLQTRQTIQEGF